MGKNKYRAEAEKLFPAPWVETDAEKKQRLSNISKYIKTEGGKVGKKADKVAVKNTTPFKPKLNTPVDKPSAGIEQQMNAVINEQRINSNVDSAIAGEPSTQLSAFNSGLPRQGFETYSPPVNLPSREPVGKMPLSYDPETIGVKAKLFGMYGDKGVDMYDKAMSAKARDEYLSETSWQDPAYDNQEPIVTDGQYVDTGNGNMKLPVATPGSLPKGVGLGMEQEYVDDNKAFELEALARANGVNPAKVSPQYIEPKDETFVGPDGKVYLNKGIYDKGSKGPTAPADSLSVAASQFVAPFIGGDMIVKPEKSRAVDPQIAEFDAPITFDSPKINPKTGKNTVKIPKNPYNQPAKTGRGTNIPGPKAIQQAAATIAKAAPAPVVERQKFATVDPLNLFGNRNGVNPFASGGGAITNARFSGGYVPQRQIVKDTSAIAGSLADF